VAFNSNRGVMQLQALFPIWLHSARYDPNVRLENEVYVQALPWDRNANSRVSNTNKEERVLHTASLLIGRHFSRYPSAAKRRGANEHGNQYSAKRYF
jgi:hypothetical protein